MIGHLLRSADFERVLRTRSRAKSAHFALHHVADAPSRPPKSVSKSITVPVVTELSTVPAPYRTTAVDDFSVNPDLPAAPVAGEVLGLWLGAVVPKRHARRAVTRSLVKRQIRAAVTSRAGSLRSGLWVVRLRAAFDRASFPSAASSALQRALRDELDGLLAGAAA